MPRTFQVAIDCADPRALGGFWAEVVGYVEEAPPEGFDTWPAALTAFGVPEHEQGDAYALVDPDGIRPRLFFHKVPEGKGAKNRLHLDVRISEVKGGNSDGKDAVLAAEAARLERLGASVVHTIDEGFEYFVVMQDPEGNEFCIT